MNKVLLISLFFLWEVASAVPTTLQVSGRILRPDNTPLENSLVSFELALLDPGGTCVLYKETLPLSMTGSGGRFSISFGSHSAVYNANGALSTTIKNSGTFICEGGGPYTPSPTDSRKIAVSFDDGGWNTITPYLSLNSVPYAIESETAKSAESVGGIAAADVLSKALAPTCVAANSFLQWNGTDFDCVAATSGSVTNVTSANAYLSVTNGTTTPLLTLNIGTTTGTVAAGDDSRFIDARPPTGSAGGDLTGTYPNPSLSNTGVAAGIYSKVTVDMKGRVSAGDILSATDIPNLDASKITTGNITNNVVNSSTASGTGSFTSLRIYDGVAQYLTLQLPLGGSSHTLSWPNAQGGAGTYLRNDGSGNLSWAAAGGGGGIATLNGLTSTAQTFNFGTTGTAPNMDSSGSIHTINLPLAQTPGVTAGLLSNTDYNNFNSKQPAGTYITALTGDISASGPGLSTASIANDAVTTSKIADNSITTSKLATDSVSTSKIQDGSITTLKLSDSGVTAGIYTKVAVDLKGRVTSGGNLSPTDIPNLDVGIITTGTLPIARGGTGANTANAALNALLPPQAAESGKVLSTDGTNTSWIVIPSAPVTSVAGKTGTVTLSTIDISGLGTAATLNVPASGDASTTEVVKGDDSRLTNGRAPTGSASGDLAGSYPGPTVSKIQGRTVSSSSPSVGQALLWDGSEWHANFVRAQDLRNSWGGTQMIPSVGCSPNQAMVWSAITDRFTCQNIANLDTSAITSGTLTPARLGSGTANNTTYLRGDGTWSTISGDPSTILHNGNSFGTSMKIGTNDPQNLIFKSGGNDQMTLSPLGHLAVGGNFNPTSVLDINGSLTMRGLSTHPTDPNSNDGRFYFNSTNRRYMAYSHLSNTWESIATHSGSSGSILFNLTPAQAFSVVTPNVAVNTLDEVAINGQSSSSPQPVSISKDLGQDYNLMLTGSGSSTAVNFAPSYLSAFTLTGETTKFQLKNDSNTPVLTILQDGKMGIGNQPPIAPLSIFNELGGNHKTTIHSAIDGTNTYPKSNSIVVQAGTAGFYYLRSYANTGTFGSIQFEISKDLTSGGPGEQIGQVIKHDGSDYRVGINTTRSQSLSYNLFVNGNAGSTSGLFNVSDARYKKDITRLPSGLDGILKLNGVSYNWNHDVDPNLNFSKRTELGVIAQEVEKVFPEAVNSPEDGSMKTVSYTMLIAPLIEAVKELYSLFQTQSQNLRQHNQELQNKLNQQQVQIQEMQAALCEMGRTQFCPQK